MSDMPLVLKMYSDIIAGFPKSDFAYTLDAEHDALWDEIAAGVANPPPGLIVWDIPS